ncbi:MAG: hypothetical protein IKL75_05090 [Bacteroidaceae bacterium]|nr:hypothetical protein [Bacteroidaceae bacterium]
MSNSSRATGASGTLSIISSILIIAFTFIPLYISDKISVWNVMYDFVEDGRDYLWIGIAYFVFLFLLLINIFVQIANCNKSLTSSLAFFSTFFIVMHIIEFSDYWQITGVTFYVVAFATIMMFVACGLPSGRKLDDDNAAVREYMNERKAETRQTSNEVNELRNKIHQMELDNEKKEIDRLKAKIERLEEEKKRSAYARPERPAAYTRQEQPSPYERPERPTPYTRQEQPSPYADDEQPTKYARPEQPKHEQPRRVHTAEETRKESENKPLLIDDNDIQIIG